MKRLFLAVLFLSLSTVACETKVKTTSACGDGVLDPGEDCDGAVLSVQRCTDLGFYEQQGELSCRPDCSLDLTVCTGTCGDGIIQTGFSEQCEGADLGGNTCLGLELGAGTLSCDACRLDTSGCELAGSCGDGVVDPSDEDCDLTDLDGQSCESLGHYPGALACAAGCTWDFSGCGGTCGDGVLQEAHEACDGTELGGWTCREVGHFSGDPSCDGSCSLDDRGCSDATRVTGGYIHTCAVLSSGGVRCWGANNNSQLGTGDGLEHPTPAGVSGVTGAEELDSGNSHVCALVGGEVVCWGDNHEGQLGDGTTTLRGTPATVGGLTSVVALSAGLYHTCVVRSDSAVWCWGDNDYQQASQSTGDRLTPEQVTGLPRALGVAAGEHHTCALLEDGTVRCWGRNNYRQMGNTDSSAVQAIPAVVVGLVGVSSLAAGNNHSCAVLGDGTARCWGRNDQGQLGNGTTVGSTSSPVPVSGLTGVTALAGGAFFTCARRQDGTVHCWGDNDYGQLGVGTMTDSTTPLAVPGLTAVTALGLGDSHACAVSNGLVWCWGYNEDGETGDGTIRNNRLSPVQTLP